MSILPSYQTTCEPYLGRFIEHTLSREKEAAVAQLLKRSYDFRLQKNNNQKPLDLSPLKRMKMIVSGEAALEEYLGMGSIMNPRLNAYGEYESKRVGVAESRIKVFEMGSLPIIYRDNGTSFIFVMQKDTRTFYLCGYAKRSRVNSFHSPQSVPLTERDRERKTCFYGFNELDYFDSVDTFKTIFG